MNISLDILMNAVEYFLVPLEGGLYFTPTPPDTHRKADSNLELLWKEVSGRVLNGTLSDMNGSIREISCRPIPSPVW